MRGAIGLHRLLVPMFPRRKSMRREMSSRRKCLTRFELVSVVGPTHLATISQFSRIIGSLGCFLQILCTHFLCRVTAFWSDVSQCASVHLEHLPRSLRANLLLIIPLVRSLSVFAQSYAQCVVCVMLVRGIAKVEGCDGRQQHRRPEGSDRGS